MSPLFVALSAGLAIFFLARGLLHSPADDLAAMLDDERHSVAPGEDAPMLVRLVGSFALRLEGESRLIRRIVSAGRERQDRLERIVVQAGRPWGITGVDLDAFTVAGSIGGAAIGIYLCLLIHETWLLGLLVGLVLGLYPRAVVSRLATERARLVKRALPGVLDLLVVAAQSGTMQLEGLRIVADKTEGPLADAIAKVVRQVENASAEPERAFLMLAEETGVEEVAEFANALITASRYGGLSYHEALNQQADRLRIAQRQDLDKQIRSLATKIVIPMTLFFLPAIFLIMIGPSMYSVLKVI
ncbi:MAG: type II secretion system F family protein [Acidimicrobiales bacterium]